MEVTRWKVKEVMDVIIRRMLDSIDFITEDDARNVAHFGLDLINDPQRLGR